MFHAWCFSAAGSAHEVNCGVRRIHGISVQIICCVEKMHCTLFGTQCSQQWCENTVAFGREEEVEVFAEDFIREKGSERGGRDMELREGK